MFRLLDYLRRHHVLGGNTKGYNLVRYYLYLPIDVYSYQSMDLVSTPTREHAWTELKHTAHDQSCQARTTPRESLLKRGPLSPRPSLLPQRIPPSTPLHSTAHPTPLVPPSFLLPPPIRRSGWELPTTSRAHNHGAPSRH